MRAAMLLLALAVAAGDLDVLAERFADPSTRWDALAELRRRMDPKAIPAVEQVLPRIDWVGQLYGVIHLNEYGALPAVDEALRRLTRAEPPYLRLVAGAWLYLRGEKTAALGVADALGEDGVDPAMRLQMLVRCYFIREPPVRSAIAALVGPGQDPALLAATLYYASLVDIVEIAVRAEPLVRHSLPGIRALAAGYRFRFGYEEDAEVLAAEIRANAIPATEWAWLYGILRASPRSSPPWRAALAERLPVEKTPATAVQILTLLTRHPHAPAWREILARVEDDEATVAAAAFPAFLATPGAATPERLLALLVSSKDDVKLRAADALRRMDDASGLPVAAKVLAEGTPADRAEAARVLGGFAKRAALVALVEALLDPDAAVRTAAAANLVELVGRLHPYRAVNLGSAGYDPAKSPEENAGAVALIRRVGNP